MAPSRPVALVLFGGVTALVWSTRIRNVLGDESVGSARLVVTLLMSATFLVAAGVMLVLAVRPASDVVQRRVVGAAGLLTLVVWVPRAIDIALGDHSVGFIVVHVVLAVASIGVAALAWRAVTRVDDCRPDAATPTGVAG